MTETRDALLQALRQKARTPVVFPLNRDECIRLTDALHEIWSQAGSVSAPPGEFKEFCAYVEHVAEKALSDEDWLDDCRIRDCQVYPPTCAPTNGRCCMDEDEDE